MSKTEKQIINELYADYSGEDLMAIGINCNRLVLENEPDMVLNPPRYNQNGIETIDYMRAYSTKEEFCGHCRLTAIKYLSRMNTKDEPLENAKKARWYLDYLIEELNQ
jgi:hypothetical protein